MDKEHLIDLISLSMMTDIKIAEKKQDRFRHKELSKLIKYKSTKAFI